MTKAELKGRTFQATRSIKGAAIEDIPAIRESLAAQIKDVPGAAMTETDTAFEFNNGQFFLKPKSARSTNGQLVCGASFARFNGCRIEYTSMTINGNEIDTDYAKYILN